MHAQGNASPAGCTQLGLYSGGLPEHGEFTRAFFKSHRGDQLVSIRQPGEVWRRVDDLRGQMTPKVVHSSPDLPRPGQTTSAQYCQEAVAAGGDIIPVREASPPSPGLPPPWSDPRHPLEALLGLEPPPPPPPGQRRARQGRWGWWLRVGRVWFGRASC